MKKAFIILIFFLMAPSAIAKTTFPDQSTCNFQVFRTDVPDVKDNYTIKVIRGSITEHSNRVRIEYNGQSKRIYCDGNWFELGIVNGFSDMMVCRVDRSGNVMPDTSISGTIRASNPYSYRNTHNWEPAIDYPTLEGTSVTKPFCETDEHSNQCKWQIQNLGDPELTAHGVGLNDWAVFSQTEVSFTIGYTIDNSILRHGDIVCGEDLNGDGVVTDDTEYTFCLNGNPIYLCPRDAIDCYNPKPAGCAIGRLDTEIDRCIETPQCPDPGSFSQTLKRCTADFEEVCDTSEPPIYTMQCPTDYSYYRDRFGDEYCVNQNPFCANGRLIRPSDYDWYCRVGNPICLQGGIYHEPTNYCYPPGYPCPYGEEFECTRVTGHAAPMCSKFPCNEVQNQGSGEGSGDKENDAEIDENGECQGTIYIFNGRDHRCRDGGLKLAWDSCCKDKDYFIGLLDCRNSERELARLKDEDLCHEIGSYCSKRVSFLGGSSCIETKKSYCCFNSKLAKIIHEQGRPQLKSFAGQTFGRASRPNCRGFTPEEFQNLDFSKIDLSEWYEEMEIMNQQQVTNSITDGVNRYYDKIY